MVRHQLGMFSHFTHSSFLFFVVAFNLGASSCVAGPSKTRYSNIISHNLSGIVGLSWFNTEFQPFCSPALGVGALKKEAAAAAVVSTKRKDASSESRSEKKRKSALEEIIEVEA